MSDDEKKMSRREFIKGAGLGSLSSIIALTTGSLLGNALAQDKTHATPTPAPEKPNMPMRPFGKTGGKVSILSLGGIIDFTANQIILKKSLDWGVNYWDTS
ncbi:MAG: aldo/keto reductase, partial [Candidatus Sumerlaeota bacterium]|nr:aldo/keto reductase [Candidatus Sumerlaeota bacterium]